MAYKSLCLQTPNPNPKIPLPKQPFKFNYLPTPKYFFRPLPSSLTRCHCFQFSNSNGGKEEKRWDELIQDLLETSVKRWDDCVNSVKMMKRALYDQYGEAGIMSALGASAGAYTTSTLHLTEAFFGTNMGNFSGMDQSMFGTCTRTSRKGAYIRSYICLKERRYSLPSKLINNSHIVQRVFSSFGQQEAKLSNDEVLKDKILTDCATDQECATGGIVALGKFDALHIGHRELAIEASKIGSPFLLSFIGMEEVFGWPSRLPIVAKCDRKRVLSSWASLCGDVAPIEFQVEFSKVRHLTPRQFVEKLSKDLRVRGVVAGENYRFGYKASGDANELVKLCTEYNLKVCIVSHVLDKTGLSNNGSFSNNLNRKDRGQVSSTRVRHALAMGDMEHVTQLLGRKHRLVLKVDRGCKHISAQRFVVPKSSVLNQPPGDNEFNRCIFLVDDVFVGECRVVIYSEMLDIELSSGNIEDVLQDGQLISIEFG